MPTYQYACTECGHQLEAVQSFSDAALTECPNCQGKLRKMFNSVGIVFKGSGFYRNDSRPGANSEKSAGNGGDSAAKPAAAGDSSSSSTSSGSGSSGSESSGSGSSGSGSSKSSASTSSAAPAAAAS